MQHAYEQLRDEHLACLLQEAAYPPLAEVLRRGGCGHACYAIDADTYEAFVAGKYGNVVDAMMLVSLALL